MHSRSRIPVARALFAPLTAVLFLLGPGLRPAMAQLLGPEFRVNSYTTNTQAGAAVAADVSGNFVVVWGSQGQDGSMSGIFGQRFDGVGLPVGTEFQVNTYTTNYQQSPVVSAGGSGDFVVVWGSNYQDGSQYGVFGQRFNSTLTRVGSEFQVNTYTPTTQRDPAVAANGSGDFVVVWDSFGQDGSSWGVFGRRFDSSGSPVGSDFQVNTYTTNYQWFPAVEVDDSGNFIVVWGSWNQDGSNSGVFAQRFNPAGSPLGSEFQVNTHTTSLQRYPEVAADGSGNFVVVWNSRYQDGASEGVFGQRFDSLGSPLGSEFQVNTFTTGGQRFPALAMDGSGNFVVAWQSLSQDGSSSYYGVFGQRFNSAGSPVASEFQVNSYTTHTQRIPAAAADGSGNFIVAWNSNTQDGSDYGVFGRRMTVALFSNGFELGDVCAWSAAVGSGDVCPP